MSPEALGFGAATGSALWATVSEFMPMQAKAIVGTALAVGAAVGAGKSWLNKRREKKEQDGDQQAG